MDGLTYFKIDKGMADDAKGFLSPEVITALKHGLPVMAFGAYVQGGVVGALGGALDTGTFDIASLYVTPAARKQGVGTGLMRTLTELLEENDGGERSTVIRAAYTEQNKDNRALEPFFKKLGFIEDVVPFPMYYLSPLKKGEIRMAAIRGNGRMLCSFEDITEELLREAEQEAALTGAPLPDGGLRSKSVDRSISYCITEGGKVAAYSSAEVEEQGLINLSAIASKLNDRKTLLVMLSVQIMAIRERFDGKTQIAMLAVDEESRDIILELFPEARPASKKFIG